MSFTLSNSESEESEISDGVEEPKEETVNFATATKVAIESFYANFFNAMRERQARSV